MMMPRTFQDLQFAKPRYLAHESTLTVPPQMGMISVQGLSRLMNMVCSCTSYVIFILKLGGVIWDREKFPSPS